MDVCRKEESKSLIEEEFGKCFEIRLRHRMRLGCELLNVFFFLGNFY